MHRHGFRARVKKGHRTFSGPVRETEADARRDEIQYKEAAGDSLEKLQKLHDEMLALLSVPVQKHNNGWRARIIKDGNAYFGPDRSMKELAESDARQLLEAGRVSVDDVVRLSQELRGVEVVERKVESFEAVMRLHLQSLLLGNISGMAKTEQKRLQRARQQDEYKTAFEACELLVTDQQATEMLAQEPDASWLRELGVHWRLDFGSRPLGTAGFDGPSAHCGLTAAGSMRQCNVYCIVHRCRKTYPIPKLTKVLWDDSCEICFRRCLARHGIMWRHSISSIRFTRLGLLFSHPARVLMLEIAVSYYFQPACPLEKLEEGLGKFHVSLVLLSIALSALSYITFWVVRTGQVFELLVILM